MLFVRDIGSPAGRPTLLLHGQMLDGRHLLPLAQALAERRVLVPDLPGYGHSPMPGAFSLVFVQEALEAECRARGIGELDVVGYSLGSYHALALALRGEVVVKSLYLLGPVPGADPAVLASFVQIACAVRGGLDVAPLFTSNALPGPWAEQHPDEIKALHDVVRSLPAQNLACECDAISNMPDLRPRLSDIRSRVLVRVGTEDRSTPLAWAECVAGSIPGAHLEVVEGVGHLYLTQDAPGTIRSVASFLGASESSPSARR